MHEYCQAIADELLNPALAGAREIAGVMEELMQPALKAIDSLAFEFTRQAAQVESAVLSRSRLQEHAHE